MKEKDPRARSGASLMRGVTCKNCESWKDAHEVSSRLIRELRDTLRAAEARNETLHGIIRLHDGVAEDRRAAAKRRSAVVDGRCVFW